MLMPDDLIIKKNCSSELIKLHHRYKSSVIASKKVQKNEGGVSETIEDIIYSFKHCLAIL